MNDATEQKDRASKINFHVISGKRKTIAPVKKEPRLTGRKKLNEPSIDSKIRRTIPAQSQNSQ
jgi:hypothetical protein